MKTHTNLAREDRINKILESRRDDLVLVLENLDDEKNISMILRTAEAFGIGQVIFVTSGKKPKISSSVSSGAAKWLNIKFAKSISLVLTNLKKQGFKVYGALVDPAAEIL